jgi:predicted dehydrogenase
MSATPLRVGVIGVGSLGIHHVRCLSQSPLAELAGIYEPLPANAERAEEFGGENHPSYEALLEKVDAMVVATPTPSHRTVAGQALELGKHVFVEKPMAATAAECDQLLELAARQDLVLHVGHVERMNPAVRAALPLINKPRFIETRRLASFGPRGADVDVVLDLMIHDLDLVLGWVGAEPVKVEAVGVSVLSGKADIASARLDFPDGAVAHLTASRVSQEKMRKLLVFQADAHFSIDCLRKESEVVQTDGGAIATIQREAASSADAVKTVAERLDSLVRRSRLPSPDGEPIALELDAFLRACTGLPALADRKPADGRAGRRAVDVAERLGDSLRKKARQWVT